MSSDDRSKLKTLDRDLKSVVFGQEPAIDALAAAIKMARSGLGRPDKPIGSFLFSGPTGVGKTEVAKQLAYILGIELIRFDMSEYMERHAVSRLIGAPPGYVGFDQGGLLTEAISKKPHAVLLLDEIEKAHPDVFNVLLQVMDHGTLTDNNGRKADFRSVIIIMTTNAGAETMNKATIGFTQLARAGRRDGRHQAPVHARVPQPARRDRSASRRSTRRSSCAWSTSSCCSSRASSAEKKVEVTFTDGLRKQLAKKGFDPLMGARPMQRLIQDTIRRALADELLFGRLVDGGRLTVDVDAEGKPVLDIQPARRRATSRRRSRRRPDRCVRHGRRRGPRGPLLHVGAVAGSWRKNAASRRTASAASRAQLARARRRRPPPRPRRTPRAPRRRRDRASVSSPRIDALAEAVVLGGQRARASRRAVARRAARHAGGHAVAHVEHVGELVDHDVVARRPPTSPASATSRQDEHHRAAFHRLAG